MTSQPQYTFTIDRNKRHQVQIESIKTNKFGQVSESVFFTKEYEHAISILNSIMNIQKNDFDKNGGCYQDEHKGCCLNNEKLGRNNIILFTGQRGSGKTSTMLSFGKYLETINNGEQFKCLPLIDPSYFDNNNNILKSVLSMMFKMAKCMLKCTNEKQEKHDINELWKCFDKVYKIIGDIEGYGKQDYSLESLNELGESSDLHDAMQRLVNEFIKVSPCKYEFLVLIIDDLDMNVSYAAQMLEQIRKFLMLDKLIILMAANLDQLQNEMREAYSSAFKHTLKDGNQTLSVDVEDLATRYLLKVFPASRRIHLYNATKNLVRTRLKIVDNSEIVIQNGNNVYIDYQNKELQKVVLTLIWERTRLLFVPKNDEMLHPIIPTNLRDLSQFINFLLDMNKVECDTEYGKLFRDADNYYLCQQNFEKFKNYIINNWIPENLSYEEEMLFNNIPHDVSEINKHLINAINVIGTKNKKRLMSREVDLEQITKNAEGVNIDRDIYTMVSPNDPRFVKANKISDIFNQPSNYSYGDLLLMIDKYETYFESEEDRRFINAVKIYYTMLLHETMFFKSTDVRYDKKDMKLVSVDTIIPLQRLLGGTVYYPNYFEIITSKFFNQKGPSYDAKRAFYHKFTFLYKIRTILSEESSSRNRIKRLNKLVEDNMHLLFYILYYGDVRPDRYDQKHIYDTTHLNDADVEGVKYATFDMLSLFSNALNPLQTIWRSYPDLTQSKVLELSRFKIEDIFKGLSEWGKLCVIVEDGKKKSYPNAILPFYSVDIMLTFLRKTYQDTTIISPFGKYEYIRDKRLSLFVKQINDYLRINEIINVNSLLDLIKKYKNNLSSDIESKLRINTYVLNLLGASKDDLYKNSRDSGPDKVSVNYYKDKVISLLYENNNWTEKERITMIKRIHEFQTISEIYNYMCDALVKDVVMEEIIRKEIQENIRKVKSIHNYYDKLWELTSVAFDRITFSNNNEPELSAIYKYIYDKGVKVFIE